MDETLDLDCPHHLCVVDYIFFKLFIYAASFCNKYTSELLIDEVLRCYVKITSDSGCLQKTSQARKDSYPLRAPGSIRSQGYHACMQRQEILVMTQKLAYAAYSGWLS
jgi:hypothetical protein